jgi:hypothetical protein
MIALFSFRKPLELTLAWIKFPAKSRFGRGGEPGGRNAIRAEIEALPSMLLFGGCGDDDLRSC